MRTTGTKTCGSCRFWSELIARAGGETTNPRGDVEALCLNDKSPASGRYTTKNDGCSMIEEGTPIDEPCGG